MMRSKTMAITALAFLAIGFKAAVAGQLSGYNSIVVPANTDVWISVPFNTAHFGAYTATGVESDGITVAAGTLAAGQYNQIGGETPNPRYYVRFTSGNASGIWMSVISNTANKLVLDQSDSTALLRLLNAVNNGDTFRIYKHHTLSSIFPRRYFYNSTTKLGSFGANTRVLLFNNNLGNKSQNKSAQLTARYSNADRKWTGTGVTDDTVLKPETKFILRNVSSSPLTFITAGTAADYTVRMYIEANGTVNDLNVSTGYPVPVMLKDSGLGGVGQRRALLPSNVRTGQNKSPDVTARYSTTDGKWVGEGVTDFTPLKDGWTFRLPASDTNTQVTIAKPYVN